MKRSLVVSLVGEGSIGSGRVADTDLEKEKGKVHEPSGILMYVKGSVGTLVDTREGWGVTEMCPTGRQTAKMDKVVVMSGRERGEPTRVEDLRKGNGSGVPEVDPPSEEPESRLFTSKGVS